MLTIEFTLKTKLTTSVTTNYCQLLLLLLASNLVSCASSHLDLELQEQV